MSACSTAWGSASSTPATPSSTSSTTSSARCGRRCERSCRPSSGFCRFWSRAGTYRGPRSLRRPTPRWTVGAAASAAWRAAVWPTWAGCPNLQGSGEQTPRARANRPPLPSTHCWSVRASRARPTPRPSLVHFLAATALTTGRSTTAFLSFRSGRKGGLQLRRRPMPVTGKRWEKGSGAGKSGSWNWKHVP